MSVENKSGDTYGGGPVELRGIDGAAIFQAPAELTIWGYGLDLQDDLRLQASDVNGFTEYLEQGGAIASLVELELLPDSELAQAA